jgi:hypothetical protein
MSSMMPRQSPERVAFYRQRASDERARAERMFDSNDRAFMRDASETGTGLRTSKKKTRRSV